MGFGYQHTLARFSKISNVAFNLHQPLQDQKHFYSANEGLLSETSCFSGNFLYYSAFLLLFLWYIAANSWILLQNYLHFMFTSQSHILLPHFFTSSRLLQVLPFCIQCTLIYYNTLTVHFNSGPEHLIICAIMQPVNHFVAVQYLKYTGTDQEHKLIFNH